MATYGWVQDSGGDWNNASNWYDSTTQQYFDSVPGPGDTAYAINVSGAIITDGAEVAALFCNVDTEFDGDLTVTGELDGGYLVGGHVSVGTFIYATFAGVTLSAGSVSGGSLIAGTATVDNLVHALVSGATVSASHFGGEDTLIDLRAGSISAPSLALDNSSNPEGALILISGGSMTIAGATSIDAAPSAPSDIIMSGGSVHLEGDLTLNGGGEFADGAVGSNVGGGAMIHQIIAGQSGSGVVFLGGTAATMTVNDNVLLGDGSGGVGVLIMNAGATLTVHGDLEAAVTSGSIASVTMSDAEALVAVTGDFQVAIDGMVTWDMSEGVSVGVAGTIVLGVESGGSAMLSVSGAGTLISGGGDVIVGEGGAVTATLASGAVFSAAGALTLAENHGAKGSATISGAGAQLVVGGNATVGEAGKGLLAIAGGGSATLSGDLTLGATSGGQGKLSVTGGGLAVAGDLIVGESGTGAVTIGAGGAIGRGALTPPNGANNTVRLGEKAGAKGSLTVKGAGAALESFGLVVGEAGAGALSVTSNGEVITTAHAVIGEAVTANIQKASITSGGAWVVEGDLSVGEAAIAETTLAAGGGLAVAHELILGVDADATGALSVTGGATSAGAASTLRWGDLLEVGERGLGTLTVASGGQALLSAGAAGLVEVAAISGATGSVTVGGSGSVLSGGGLALGGTLSAKGGTGSLAVASGGAARFGGASIIWTGDEARVASGGVLALGSMTNDGVIAVAGGAVSIIGGFGGTGTVAVADGGRFSLDAVHAQSGARVRISLGQGAITLKGSAHNDLFAVTAAALTAQDVIAGGAGGDTLQLITAGAIAASAFTHVAGIETVKLASGVNSLTLTNALVAGADAARLTVLGGGGADTVNAALVTSGGTVVFNGEGGADAITGGKATIYEFDNRAGSLAITNAMSGGTAAHGDLAFGAGLTDQTLWLSSSGANLVVDVLGTTEHVTLSGWFGANRSAKVKEIEAGGLKLDTGVAKLVSAMAAYAAANPGFSPTTPGATMPTNTTLQAAITANWHH
jgi:T5SS/PEP-CTERM-associated repeat protein